MPALLTPTGLLESRGGQTEVDTETYAEEDCIAARLARIDAEFDALVAQDAPLQRGRDATGRIAGIGPAGLATLTAPSSRVLFGSADAVVASSRLDP